MIIGHSKMFQRDDQDVTNYLVHRMCTGVLFKIHEDMTPLS